MNWPVLILFALGAIVLLVFIIKRNFKDEKDFEQQLGNDYHKPKHTDADTNREEAGE